MVLFTNPLGEPHGGERLEQREERSSEQSGLLARNDGDGIRVAQLSGGGERFSRGAAAALLSLHEVGDRLSLARCCCVRADGASQAAGSAGLPA